MDLRILPIGLVLCAVGAANALGAEPWAHAELPVHQGLLMWLDAQAQPKAWSGRDGVEVLEDVSAFDLWYDASGNEWDLAQPTATRQPVFRKHGEHAFVRFDGVDDFLSRTGGGKSLLEFTAFVFAAPSLNSGDFRAFLCASRLGKNDYQTGFNIDQGFFATPRFEVVNVEGAGFEGARDLLDHSGLPFGKFHLIEVSADGDGVKVVVDGKPSAATRPRQSTSMATEQVTVGVRLLSAPELRGLFEGDVAEILLYDRALDHKESTAVRKYLQKKHDGIDEVLSELDGELGRRLQAVENPPAVQMFVPGFSVQQLPVALSNINNVQYRHDGVLVALAYDGNVHLLRDTDGDGLEDDAKLFWNNQGRLRSPIGMALTRKNYPRGEGLFVASKGKCSLIVDSDGDDRADKEVVVADGWKELGHGVDALGVALDKRDGSVWFGLGTQNFTNPYLVGPDGKAAYDLGGERGTILRVAPNFESREVYCTGVRFPVALRFNAAGDLFCTDQEGATWLPNGNPFDELLHLRRGRHYGFPPRHPKHLPDVVDEPSTYDYRPQHQSTCGMNFNEQLRKDAPVFGPPWWRADALVAGYSRGKLYRTKLVRTGAGYVAQNNLIAALSMLPADVCVSPRGALVVAVHSGGPDWGSGPAGAGKLYKIFYSDPKRPQPVAVWPEARRQVRIAFDRPLEPTDLKGLAQGVRIEHGAWLAAGDRFESLRPGYAVVQKQTAGFRKDLSVTGVHVTPDRRTVVLDTAPHRAAEHYGITLEGLGRAKSAGDPDGVLRQVAETDLHYTLNGIAATLTSNGRIVWQGWLPHLDSGVSETLTAQSSGHDQFRKLADDAEILTLATQLDLNSMLRPRVQPGSTLDFELPKETVTMVFRSDAAVTVKADPSKSSVTHAGEGATLTAAAGEDRLPVEITLKRRSAEDSFALSASWHTNEDDTPRPLALRRFFVPWTERSPKQAASDEAVAMLPRELDGGSWGRGRKVFFGEKAGCAKCHRVGGQGGNIGPSLENLRHRDYASVKRDVVDPSFAINPDHLTYSLLLDDGRVLTGLVRKQGGRLVVGTEKAEEIRIDPESVERMAPSRVSVMPEGIEKQIGAEAMRDLLTFLIGPPPRMPQDRDGAPPRRTRSEVTRALKGSVELTKPPEPLNILLVAGAKDHGPGEHDYPAWQSAWTELFRAADNVSVSTAMGWPDREALAQADAMVVYQRGDWNDDRAADTDAFLKKGGGVTYIHYAVDGGNSPQAFAQRIGLAWQGGASRFRHGALDLILNSSHPIARNLTRVKLEDESYWNLSGDPENVTIIGTGYEQNVARPLVWCCEKGNGRIFVSIPGHYSWTFDDPLFRLLVLRGVAWSARQGVDRFNDLATLGVELAE